MGWSDSEFLGAAAEAAPAAPAAKPAKGVSFESFMGVADDELATAAKKQSSPGTIAANALKDAGGNLISGVAAAGDMIFGAPASLASKFLNVGTRVAAIASGESRKVQGLAGAEAEHMIPESLKQPFTTVLRAFGGKEYDQSIVQSAMDKLAEGTAKHVPGITKEDAAMLFGTAMDAGGIVGLHQAVKAVTARAAEKPKAAKPAEEDSVSVGPLDVETTPGGPTLREVLDAQMKIPTEGERAKMHSARLKELKKTFKEQADTATWLEDLASRRMEAGAHELVAEAERLGRSEPPSNRIDWQDVNEIMQKPGHMRSPEEMIRARAYMRNLGANSVKGAADQRLLNALAAGSVGALAGYYIGQKLGEDATEGAGVAAAALATRGHSSLKGLGEAELVGLARQGNDAAITQLYNVEAPRLERTLTRYTRDPELAKDITQETMMGLAEALKKPQDAPGGFRGDSKVSTWLHTAALNRARNSFKAKDSRIQESELTPEIEQSARDTSPSSEQVAMSSEVGKHLQEGIEKLDWAQRTAFEGVELEGRTYAEMATELGVPEGTLRSHVSRAKEALRQHMGKLEKGAVKKVLGGAGLGAAAYLADPENAGRNALLAAAVLAVKEKGGMWHPEAISRLSSPLRQRMVPAAELENAIGENNLVPQAIDAWGEKVVRNYLNRHAGTATDPLKDIEVPFGEGTKRWEELTDSSMYNRRGIYPIDNAKFGLKPGEPLYEVGPASRTVEGNPTGTAALQSYLSHVGDYLREHVPADKLQQYDLVRAVKETATWDKELAKNMEKASLDDTKGSPVYKDYGDGMKWVQLTKPGQFARESDTMGHSVRGYEPEKGVGKAAADAEALKGRYAKEGHPDWTPASGDSGHPSYGLGGWEAIKRGDAKIYSLRDAKEKSHVTIEVSEGGRTSELDFYGEPVEGLSPSTRDIVQIKGKQNRAPSTEYLPYVQDFVKGGKWGEVGDLGNTGLVRMQDGSYKTQEQFRAEGEATFRNPQRGSVDPKLLIKLGAAAIGATAGSALSEDSPILGAVIGGLAGGALTNLRPKAAVDAILNVFGADKRIRINDLADAHETGIARAGRAIWQQQMKIVDAVKETADREAITKAIQGGTVRALPERLQAAANQARSFFSALGEAGQKSGVLNGLIDNYVTNLWDLSGKNKGVWDEIMQKAGGPSMSPESRFALKRRIMSLEEGKKLGLTPVTEDVAQIMGIYGNSLARSMENKQLIQGLREMRDPATERKLLIAADKAPQGYEVIDHPQLRGMKVHPDILPSMKFIFDNSDPGVVMRGLEGLNTAIKRSAVSFSLFHLKALGDALLGAAANPIEAAKIFGASLAGTNQYLKMLKKGDVGDLVDTALEGGLKFSYEKGKLADEDVGGSFYTGMKMLQKGLDSAIPGAGLPIAAATKINHMVDTLMWERAHAGMKLSVFANKLEVLRNADAKAAAREGRKPRAEKELAAQSASFTNDIFGGLNWRRIAEEAHTKWGRDIATAVYSPSGRRGMQLLMFAPDWTISTTRAASRTFGQLLGYEKGSGARGLIEPQNATDLHRQYLVRSALYYAAIGDGLNYYFSGHHLWDNKDPTRVDLGDGRTMQWSKHSMEPVHWLTQPGQQALNKLGFFPKETANQALGTEYLSASGHAPRMDTSVAGRVSHLLRSVQPIAGQQAFGGNSTPEGAVSGFFGAPIYGMTQEQRLEKKRQQKLERLRKKYEETK